MKSPKGPLSSYSATVGYDEVSLFPEKVALAKKMLAKTNLKKLYKLLPKQRAKQ